MSEIINCPGCGAEISDDCGNCLLCGKEIKAGAHPAVSAANEETVRTAGTETIAASDIAPEIKTQPKKRSAFESSSGSGNHKDNDLEKFRAPREDPFRSVSFINGNARPASLAASLCMLFFSIAGFSVAVAISFVIGIIAVFSGPRNIWGGGPGGEQYIIIFAFAFLAANAITGGNFGYRAGRYIARAFGMDIGSGPGPSSDFLWGGYAGGFSCALLFSFFVPNYNSYNGRSGDEILVIYFFACIIAVIVGIYWALAKRAEIQNYSCPYEPGYDQNISGSAGSESVPDMESGIYAGGWFRDISGCFVSAIIGAYTLEAASVQFINKTIGLSRVMVPSFIWLFLAGAIGAIAGIALFVNYRKTVLIAKENGGMEGFFRDSLFFVICALFFSAAFSNIISFMTPIFSRNLGIGAVICATAVVETIGAYIGVNFGLALNRNLALNFSRIRSAPQTMETMLLAVGHGFLAGICALIISYMAFETFQNMLTVTVNGAAASYYIFHFAVSVVTSLAVSAGMYYGIVNQKRK